jgi:hypothetical protein
MNPCPAAAWAGRPAPWQGKLGWKWALALILLERNGGSMQGTHTGSLSFQ